MVNNSELHVAADEFLGMLCELSDMGAAMMRVLTSALTNTEVRYTKPSIVSLRNWLLEEKKRGKVWLWDTCGQKLILSFFYWNRSVSFFSLAAWSNIEGSCGGFFIEDWMSVYSILLCSVLITILEITCRMVFENSLFQYLYLLPSIFIAFFIVG